jgi:hypothetical protein
MRLGKAASVEEARILGQFEELRRILRASPRADLLEKTLAYWVLPTDRRLPLALLGRTLGELLDSSPAELAATPGVGRKKMAALAMLLARAANHDDHVMPDVPPTGDQPAPSAAQGGSDAPTEFKPLNVSEMTWAAWQAGVRRHGLEREPLGRMAPSLRNMTRVIWNTPLDAYLHSSLAEIRSRKTHGEKRVRAILEVFQAVAALVAGMGPQDQLATRILPRRIDRVERWSEETLARPDLPRRAEISAGFVAPLMEQIRIDASPQVAALAEDRLGLRGRITSVRQAARQMNLTRARVYQLLNEIAEIMAVRWPAGPTRTRQLREKFAAQPAEFDKAAEFEQFHAAVDLFYPGGRRAETGRPPAVFPPEREPQLLEVI